MHTIAFYVLRTSVGQIASLLAQAGIPFGIDQILIGDPDTAEVSVDAVDAEQAYLVIHAVETGTINKNKPFTGFSLN